MGKFTIDRENSSAGNSADFYGVFSSILDLRTNDYQLIIVLLVFEFVFGRWEKFLYNKNSVKAPK